MSCEGTFVIEERDIVRLDVDPDQDLELQTDARHGWVNVGVHALKIMVDSDGNLTVEAYPRSREWESLGVLRINKLYAEAQGGKDERR